MRLITGTAPLRSYLAALAAAGGLVALLVAAAAAWWSWQAYRNGIGASLAATSRAITESVDRELGQAMALARALAKSDLLTRDDFAAFERQAREVIAPYGYDLVLTSPDIDHQLVNTQVPLGTELPKLLADPLDPQLVQGGVRVAPLRRSRLSDVWFVRVEVPALDREGELRYVVAMLVPSAAFQRIMGDQHLPASWSPVILDGEWTVVARGVESEKFLGRKGGAREFQSAPDGLHEVRLLDGDWALSSHSHSRRYGWTAAVAMPRAAMLREALSPIMAAALSGFAVAALAIGAVLVFATHIGRGIGSLARATRALAKAEQIELPRFFVRELTLVGEGMQHAAAEIAARRHDLETRIAAATRELRREAEERRKAEAALAHAQRLESLGQLTGGVAHDFNNLLTVISGSLDLIEAKSPNEQLKDLARRAQRGVSRGARLVEALLAFARKQPLRAEVANPNLVIKDFLPVLRGAAGDTVQLQLLLSPTVFPCRFDLTQLQSAVLNLVTNACAAMRSGGRITIETHTVEIGMSGEPGSDLTPGSYVLITVADTGSGMSPEVAARAFEPFFTTKEVGVGTGLGLSQVYGFVKQSGGDVTLSSEPGVGTIVRLYLPRSLEAETVAPKSTVTAQTPCAGGPAVIMVVDDDPEVRAVLVDGVAALGYRATKQATATKHSSGSWRVNRWISF